MLQSHLLFCPYIRCVCLRISKKTGGNGEINSINSNHFSPHLEVSGCCSSSQSWQEQKTAWESEETVVCFDSSVVKRSALTKQREQKSSSESTVQEASLVFCSLRPRSQCQGWPLWRRKKKKGKKKCRGQLAGWSSLCLYVRIGSYTLGSSCVQVYIQSHVRKDQGGALSKQVHTLTGGEGEGGGHSQLGDLES